MNKSAEQLTTAQLIVVIVILPITSSACPRQKKHKLYKSSINKSIHFAQRRLSNSTRVQVQRVTAQLNLCFVNRKSSKSEGKFPTFRSGNPHYPKETCREFSFFHLSSRKESSIHCFLPNRVIRVRLCQRLPERFAFNVLSFDSAPAPG